MRYARGTVSRLTLFVLACACLRHGPAEAGAPLRLTNQEPLVCRALLQRRTTASAVAGQSAARRMSERGIGLDRRVRRSERRIVPQVARREIRGDRQAERAMGDDARLLPGRQS